MVGYTSGGSPIFYSIGKTKKKKRNNKVFKCKLCNHGTTKNQLKLNGGHCQKCKAVMVTSGICHFCKKPLLV